MNKVGGDGTNGSGVYVAAGGTFVMKDDARVDSSSEVYLDTGAMITIGNALTSEVTVARIRLKEYSEGSTPQVLDEAAAGLINRYYNYFMLISPGGSS